MDELVNVTATEEALAAFSTAVANLKDTIQDIETNKSTINNAWVSDNATSFISTYGDIKAKLDTAYTCLANYQEKISNVVKEIKGFDSTITTSSEEGA